MITRFEKRPFGLRPHCNSVNKVTILNELTQLVLSVKLVEFLQLIWQRRSTYGCKCGRKLLSWLRSNYRVWNKQGLWQKVIGIEPKHVKRLNSTGGERERERDRKTWWKTWNKADCWRFKKRSKHTKLKLERTLLFAVVVVVLLFLTNTTQNDSEIFEETGLFARQRSPRNL